MASFRMQRVHHRTGNRGFLLSSALVALMSVLMLIPLCTASIASLRGVFEFQEEVQDEIASLQLRRLFLCAYEIEVSPDAVSFVLDARQMQLLKVNRHIIISPGTQIFYADVDTCEFIVDAGLVYVEFERDAKQYRKVLLRIP